ncbi:hypothetical protein KVR01_000276 [Diaporthe batatas]|uniref:uncharacterized protein n=1 Tax=Diaporthe batatas TaxID=748121 RepID=UPI001D05B89F|nr:uncharacterized protein KVR01_000276 [Diaporthe batatas]KAG8169531.1 hypothetical protein KVR01_000276 [Diaporthe batatas]
MDTGSPSLITTGLVVVSVIFPLLSLASVLLRVKARLKTKQGILADDWWIVATWVLSIALSINVWAYAGIIGVNSCTVDALSCSVYAAVCLVVASCLVQVVLTTVKVSILLLYKRIFAVRPFRIATWIAVVFVSLWGIAMILIVALQGNPATFVRTTAANEVYVWRLDPVIVGYTQVGSSLILDVVILCFPLPIISTLHMPTRRKFMVGAIFWLGIFCCVASAVRLALNHKVLTSILSQQASVWSLPTFGPLVAGGRAPESLIRSVRSILSLASGGSSPRGSRGSKSRSGVRLPDNSDSRQDINAAEHGEFTSHGTTEVHIKSDSTDRRTEEIELNDLDGGINVTRGVDVVRGH